MPRTLSLGIAICAALFLFSVQNALACSCLVNSTVDVAFRETPNVVIVRLDELQAKKNRATGEDIYYLSKMTVNKVFKGTLRTGQQLDFGTTGTSCDYTFSKDLIGTEWLFYLDEAVKANVWYYPACTRSRSIESGTLDIKYLENISSVKGKSRLSGNVSQQIESAVENRRSERKRLVDRNIRIVGNGRDLNLKTDENGDYEIYDLPPGKYKISVDPITGFKTTYFDAPTIESVDIVIKAGQQVEKDFTYFVDNSIGGRILDAESRPLNDVCIDLYPSEGSPTRHFYNADCTDIEGKFKLDQIPPGKYVLVINKDGKITTKEPFGTFYYPNKVNKEDATVVSIGPGEHLSGIEIKAPVTAETVVLSGRVVFEKGGVDDKYKYEFVSADFRADQRSATDETISTGVDKDGYFSIRLFKGQAGILYGEILAFQGDKVNCPKLERILKLQGKNSDNKIKTNIVKIDGKNDVSDIVLTLPFPSCKSAD